MHLNGSTVRRPYSFPDIDTAIDLVALPFAQRFCRLVSPIGVGVDLYAGAAFTGHDDEAGILEHLVVVDIRNVLADRNTIKGSPVAGIEDFNGACEQRPRVGSPSSLGNRNVLTRGDFVAAVKVDRRKIVGRHRVVQDDHRAGIDHIACIRGHPWRGAVGHVAIAPDLCTPRITSSPRTVEIGGIGNVGIVAILPLVIVHNGVVRGRSDRDVRLHRAGRSIPASA